MTSDYIRFNAKRRPVRNREGFFEAYKLWCQLESIGTIIEKTKVSDKTVTNWVNLFKEADEDEVSLDTPFESSLLRQFDFDWSDLLAILELVNGYESERKSKPSFRQTFWAQRLSHSVPVPEVRGERNYLPLFRLTDKFVSHEIEELHGQPTTRTSTELSEALEGGVK